jgi:hypothetical protein
MEITLIGHSMGTIIINEIIRRFPKLQYKDIIYMAAACTIRDFECKVAPLMSTNTDIKIYNLCLHPIAEASEAQWQFLDLTPRGSLLEWIDNLFSEPETHNDRVFGKWENIIKSTSLIDKNFRFRFVLKAFSVGEINGINRHIDFASKNFWSHEFRKIN